MDIVSLLQWPAMAASLVAAWLVASQSKKKRKWGFWWFLLSNVIWSVWGLQDKAWALIALQICLAAMNIRGTRKNESPS
jgi:hypothetical protein